MTFGPEGADLEDWQKDLNSCSYRFGGSGKIVFYPPWKQEMHKNSMPRKSGGVRGNKVTRIAAQRQP